MSEATSLGLLRKDQPAFRQPGKSHLPPQQRKTGVTVVPVTPGTYTEPPSQLQIAKRIISPREEYFSLPSNSTGHTQARFKHRKSPIPANVQPNTSVVRKLHKTMQLSGNVISVTFTAPQVVQYREGSEWVTSSTPITPKAAVANLE
jgi:hypothetical protein